MLDRFVAPVNRAHVVRFQYDQRVTARITLGRVLWLQGLPDQAMAEVEAAIAELRAGGFVLYLTAFLGALGEGLAAAGRPAEGLGALDTALAQCARSGETWCLAELYRLRGEILAVLGQDDAAEAAFREGLKVARDQQGLSWTLRAATSLAGLWRRRGRPHEAVTLLEEAMAAMTEGFARPDFQAASCLHQILKNPPRAH